MKRLLAASAAAACATIALAQTGGPVANGDLAWGLSRATASQTARLIRSGADIGGWTPVIFLQSMEFDNKGGTHSASGNLLSMNFGATATGGSLVSLATNGTDAGQTIFLLDGLGGPISGPLTRTGGLSVSPDNTHVAFQGYDLSTVCIMDYVAGNSDGTGASVSNLVQSPGGTFLTGSTQGTAWYDNNTVLMYRIDTNFGFAVTDLIGIDLAGNVTVLIDDIPVTNEGSRFLDVEYNPCISPYIYCMYASFLANGAGDADDVTVNTLSIVDPASWTVVKQTHYDWIPASPPLVMNSAREIALGPDRNLYVAAFGFTAQPPWIDVIDLDLDNDGDIDAADVAAMTNNSSVDYVQSNPTVGASFSGIDVAMVVSCGGCTFSPCDADCNGTVNPFDIQDFLGVLAGGDGCSPCAGDADGNGTVNPFDINAFLACLSG